MLVKDLPKDIYDVAIKHRIKQYGSVLTPKDLELDDAFNWSGTPEGGDIWCDVHEEDFKPFRKFHHNKLKAGDTVEYFKPITQEDWSEFGIASINCSFTIGDKLKIYHVSDDDICTIMFENHPHHFPSHCFRKVEIVEEPPHPFKEGDTVRIKREFFNLFERKDLENDKFIVTRIDKYKSFRPHSLQNTTLKNVITLDPGYGGFYLADCFELYTEKPKEEPIKEPIKEPIEEPIEDFEVGDKVVYYREPTEADWKCIGEVRIRFNIGDELTVKHIGSSFKSLLFKEEIADGFLYPKSCFRKVTTEKSLPSNWFVKCYKDIDKTPLLFEWRARNCKNPEDVKWYSDGYISSTSIHGSFNLFAGFGYKEITYEQFVRDVYQPWKETQKKVLNPIHQHYEDGGKVRRKQWNKSWIQKYSETESIDESGHITDSIWSFITNPESWVIVAEEPKAVQETKTTINEVPEYWYFPLNDCTKDELEKFQKFKDSKASSYINYKIYNYSILLNFHSDKSYYYVSGIEQFKKAEWFKQSAVELTKEEFYRLIYNPWEENIINKKENSNNDISISPKEEIRPISPDHKLILSSKNKKKLLLQSYDDFSINVQLKKSKS